MPEAPPVPCPDCDGEMHLQRKPPSWGGGSAWVYRCEHVNTVRNCNGKLSAHPDGSPVGEAVKQEIRTARRFCHSVFDPLWKRAWMIYEIAETDQEGHGRAIKRITGKMRHRAYCYVADQLGMSEEDCHVGKITDIETLRKFYRAARQATPAKIRAWARERGL